MRRTLPSLSTLVAFEAAARRANFTRAGEELSLTQSAVSSQVAQLERFLGIQLFERVRRRVILTKAGAAYASRIRAALDNAETATLDMLASKAGEGILHISSLATFASHWLTPRLASFTERHPNITFQLSIYRHESFDTGADDVDVAIHYGEPSWPDGLVDLLMDEEIMPMCSPAYAEAVGLRTPADLDKATFLQQATRPDAWTDLLVALKRDDIHALRGPRFELYGMVIEAAIAGLGVGAIPRFLADADLASGRLVVPFDCAVRSRHNYYLVHPEAKRRLPEVQAFRTWILREARQGSGRRRR